MGNKTNKSSKLTEFDIFKKKVILKLQNYSLQKLNPIFAGGGAFFDYDEEIRIIYPILDIKIFQALHPFSTLTQVKYLPAPAEDKELISWTTYLKERIVIERSYTQLRYKVHTLETVPFYIRIFCDAARESFKPSIVFIIDGLPSELKVYVYPQRKYKRSKEKDLKLIAGLLLGRVDEKKEKRVEIICRNYPFRKALGEILKLPKQPIDTNISYCLACGTLVEEGDRFCNSREVHGTENPGNCRDKFHNWLRRRLSIEGLAAEREARERLYGELQDTIRTEGPFNAFKTFRDNHRGLYTERHRGPKKKA